MKINLVYVNPGGNPTALVLTSVARQKQGGVAKKIMQKIKTCEQVGFIERAKNSKAVFRLQMMGGEFCGNALRSLAAFLAGENKKDCNFIVETSGTKKLIRISAKTDRLNKILYAEANFPIVNIPIIVSKQITLGRNKILTKFVQLDGICFFIVPQEFFRAKINYKLFFQELYTKNIIQEQACGLIFYKKGLKNTFAIKPIVYVKQTNSLIYETSCASGSMALMLAMGLKKIKVIQPSGFELNLKQDKEGVLVKGKVGEVKGLEIEV